MNCHDYWIYLLEEKNVKEEKDLPIWKWSVFENPEDARREMNVIRDILTPSLEMECLNGDYSAEVSVLFLVHCALKMRLDLLWSDNIDSYRGCFSNITQQKWGKLIKKAEKRVLKRPPLLEDAEAPRPYEARVKVEAGLPANSLCQTENGFFRDLKRIWNRMDFAESVLQRWGEEEFSKDPKIAFAGGIGAGLAFFQYATEILRDVDTCQKKTGDSISSILIHRHHFNGPLESFEDYLNNDNERDTGINWRKLLNIKRILCLGAKPKLVTYYKISDHCYNIDRLTLVNPVEKDDRTWEYEKNGFLCPGQKRAGSYSDASKKISIVVDKRDGGREEQVVIDKLSNDVLYFKPYLDEKNREIVKNYFETISLPTKKSNIEFPLVAAIPEGEKEIDVSLLEKFFRGNFTADNLYRVYLINNLDEYNQSGLGKLALKMRMEPLLQYVQTSINGKFIHNLSLGYPHSPATSLPLYYKASEEWKRVPLYSNLNEIELRKFKLGESCDAAETEVVVFPRGFRYEYQYSSEARCYRGLKLYNGSANSNLLIKELRIDNEIACPELWKTLKHESDIQCDIEINDEKILTLHLPSPCPGISWICSSENDVKNGLLQIPLCEVSNTRLRYVFDNNNRSSQLHWIISMYDGDEHILQREDYIATESLNCQGNTILAELPNYLEKLFSATNSLMAEIRIEAHMLLDGEYKRAASKDRYAKIVVSRFDEKEPSQNTSYFYFGIYNPKEHCSRLLDCVPNEEELSKDRWIKVPAEVLPDGRLEWDGVHRIRPLHNEKDREIETGNLSALQKCLVSNNYTEVQDKLKEYFVNDNLSDEDCAFIDEYVVFCLTHRIPLCNLWLLQAVLECDWIACQIPSINKLLKMSSYKFAFDVRLLRPEIIAKYNKNHTLDDILKNWSEPFNPQNVVKTSLFNDYENNDDLKGLCDCAFWHSVKGTFDNLGRNYGRFFEKFFDRPWAKVEPWEKVVCYIAHNVILTPEGDDSRNRQHYSNAMLCLRFLESIDENAVSSLLDAIVRWKFFKRREYAFKTSANRRAGELKVEIGDVGFENIDDKLGCSENEAKKNGCEYVEMFFKNRQEEEQKRLEEQRKIEKERKKILDERKEAWRALLQKYRVSESDFAKNACTWRDGYESLADGELEEQAKDIAEKIGAWPPKPTKEEWENILREKGLPETFFKLNVFKFESSYKFFRIEQLEKRAEDLIHQARMRRLIS